MTPAEFLQALWGSSPPGRPYLWSGRTKDTLDAGPLVLASCDNAPDLYTGVSVAAHDAVLSPRTRPKAHESAGIAGLWLDLDVEPGKLPSFAAAQEVAYALAEPTIVINSGGGWHCWYLLPEPLAIRDGNTRSKVAILADAWVTAHQQIAQARGWNIDRACDLARILRVPGTVNAKREPHRPVVAEVADGPRHHIAYLNSLVREHVPAAQRRHMQKIQAQPGQVVHLPSGAPDVDADLLGVLLANSAEFARAWHRQCPPSWGQSEYDMALAHWCLEAELPEQQTVAIMRAHRLANPDPSRHAKAGRADYYRMTLAKARVKRDSEHEKARRQAEVDDMKRALGIET
jgi:hypothetical protein